MRRVFQTISWLALAATIAPAVLVYLGTISLDQMKLTMLLATIGWFVHTPLWMGRK